MFFETFDDMCSVARVRTVARSFKRQPPHESPYTCANANGRPMIPAPTMVFTKFAIAPTEPLLPRGYRSIIPSAPCPTPSDRWTSPEPRSNPGSLASSAAELSMATQQSIVDRLGPTLDNVTKKVGLTAAGHRDDMAKRAPG